MLDEIAERRPQNLSEDDVTVFIARANGREPRYRLRDKAEAVARFTGSLPGSIHPRAERPPPPDLNAGDIGGATIAALARRWRARPGS